jgi:hypothetical protein
MQKRIQDYDFSNLDNEEIDVISFKEDVAIDKYNLEDEWCKQPSLAFKWTALVAEAERKLDKLKTEREICRANLDSEIRKHPITHGLGKVTENAIEGIIVNDDSYKEVSNRYIEAKRHLGIVQAASKAIDHRKQALEGLVKLYLNNYYVQPYVPKEFEDKVTDQSRDEQNEMLNNNLRLKANRKKEDSL